MLTTLSKNWVKVNHFVPWRQCLRFHPQQTHFHSGCSVEVIQVLAVSDGRDGLSTNSIYSIMWQSKKHFFPSASSIPTVQCRYYPPTFHPDRLLYFCPLLCLHCSFNSTAILFFFLHRFPLWLLSLFFMHAALPSSDSSPQSCLFS